MLRRIFGPKRDEVTGNWKTLYSEEFNDLYSSPRIFRGDEIEKNGMGGSCSTYGGEEKRIRGFGGVA